MTQSDLPHDLTQPAQFILHPTDFSPESDQAFCHALRLALDNHASLTLLHADADPDLHWDQFPSIRKTLQRWGRLEENANREEVSKLGLRIEKILSEDKDFVHIIGDYLLRHQIDLLVMSTHGRHGLLSLIKPSAAARAARTIEIPSLFVPAECSSCVSSDTGKVTMNQVLIPIDHDPPCEAAIERGLRAIATYGHQQSKLMLLHIGPESNFPEVSIPSGPWKVERVALRGHPVAEILRVADDIQANLLVMVTKGTHGFMDILRGTTTEQVLSRAPCPVLSVPADY